MQQATPHKAESFLPPLWIISLMVAAAFIWLLVTLKELVVLLVLGYSLAYLIAPVLSYLEKKGISRSVGFFVVVGIFLIVVLIAMTTALPTVIEEVQRLLENFPQYFTTARRKLFDVIEDLRAVLPPDLRKRLAFSPEDLSGNFGPETVRGISNGVLNALLTGYSLTLTIFNLLLLPFIVFYISVDFRYVHRALLSLFPRKYQPTVLRLAKEIDVHVSAFVRGQFLVGAILCVLYCLGLGFIGIDLWFIIALISGIGNLVPYVGSLIGIVLASIMALVTFGDLIHVGYVLLVFTVVQFLEGTFITPRIVGGQVGLSPLTVILAIFAAGKIFGLLGIFLAIPIAAAVRVTGNYFHAWFLRRIEDEKG